MTGEDRQKRLTTPSRNLTPFASLLKGKRRRGNSRDINGSLQREVAVPSPFRSGFRVSKPELNRLQNKGSSEHDASKTSEWLQSLIKRGKSILSDIKKEEDQLASQLEDDLRDSQLEDSFVEAVLNKPLLPARKVSFQGKDTSFKDSNILERTSDSDRVSFDDIADNVDRLEEPNQYRLSEIAVDNISRELPLEHEDSEGSLIILSDEESEKDGNSSQGSESEENPSMSHSQEDEDDILSGEDSSSSADPLGNGEYYYSQPKTTQQVLSHQLKYNSVPERHVTFDSLLQQSEYDVNHNEDNNHPDNSSEESESEYSSEERAVEEANEQENEESYEENENNSLNYGAGETIDFAKLMKPRYPDISRMMQSVHPENQNDGATQNLDTSPEEHTYTASEWGNAVHPVENETENKTNDGFDISSETGSLEAYEITSDIEDTGPKIDNTEIQQMHEKVTNSVSDDHGDTVPIPLNDSDNETRQYVEEQSHEEEANSVEHSGESPDIDFAAIASQALLTSSEQLIHDKGYSISVSPEDGLTDTSIPLTTEKGIPPPEISPNSQKISSAKTTSASTADVHEFSEEADADDTMASLNDTTLFYSFNEESENAVIEKSDVEQSRPSSRYEIHVGTSPYSDSSCENNSHIFNQTHKYVSPFDEDPFEVLNDATNLKAYLDEPINAYESHKGSVEENVSYGETDDKKESGIPLSASTHSDANTADQQVGSFTKDSGSVEDLYLETEEERAQLPPTSTSSHEDIPITNSDLNETGRQTDLTQSELEDDASLYVSAIQPESESGVETTLHFVKEDLDSDFDEYLDKGNTIGNMSNELETQGTTNEDSKPNTTTVTQPEDDQLYSQPARKLVNIEHSLLPDAPARQFLSEENASDPSFEPNVSSHLINLEPDTSEGNNCSSPLNIVHHLAAEQMESAVNPEYPAEESRVAYTINEGEMKETDSLKRKERIDGSGDEENIVLENVSYEAQNSEPISKIQRSPQSDNEKDEARTELDVPSGNVLYDQNNIVAKRTTISGDRDDIASAVLTVNNFDRSSSLEHDQSSQENILDRMNDYEKEVDCDYKDDPLNDESPESSDDAVLNATDQEGNDRASEYHPISGFFDNLVSVEKAIDEEYVQAPLHDENNDDSKHEVPGRELPSYDGDASNSKTPEILSFEAGSSSEAKSGYSLDQINKFEDNEAFQVEASPGPDTSLPKTSNEKNANLDKVLTNSFVKPVSVGYEQPLDISKGSTLEKDGEVGKDLQPDESANSNAKSVAGKGLLFSAVGAVVSIARNIHGIINVAEEFVDRRDISDSESQSSDGILRYNEDGMNMNETIISDNKESREAELVVSSSNENSDSKLDKEVPQQDTEIKIPENNGVINLSDHPEEDCQNGQDNIVIQENATEGPLTVSQEEPNIESGDNCQQDLELPTDAQQMSEVNVDKIDGKTLVASGSNEVRSIMLNEELEVNPVTIPSDQPKRPDRNILLGDLCNIKNLAHNIENEQFQIRQDKYRDDLLFSQKTDTAFIHPIQEDSELSLDLGTKVISDTTYSGLESSEFSTSTKTFNRKEVVDKSDRNTSDLDHHQIFGVSSSTPPPYMEVDTSTKELDTLKTEGGAEPGSDIDVLVREPSGDNSAESVSVQVVSQTEDDASVSVEKARPVPPLNLEPVEEQREESEASALSNDVVVPVIDKSEESESVEPVQVPVEIVEPVVEHSDAKGGESNHLDELNNVISTEATEGVYEEGDLGALQPDTGNVPSEDVIPRESDEPSEKLNVEDEDVEGSNEIPSDGQEDKSLNPESPVKEEVEGEDDITSKGHAPPADDEEAPVEKKSPSKKPKRAPKKKNLRKLRKRKQRIDEDSTPAQPRSKRAKATPKTTKQKLVAKNTRSAKLAKKRKPSQDKD
ncbi:Esc1p KNAG_0J02050 [Huiozyma naganishii CBS 8797]|uniref:Uncharacterized protein n=1 Tax=Huiozyma naganishii (strain ATCC MYA-139 / BCRC 22969 / CBS 8797 / KCTC 17520 / NBRC 10181 / NCYC 3082 / Yp74L-3) TaxID=1071383 RepID=J7SAL8_HUIN7|nr:hypothetical protein KNAG_0J02050 [Kazachstania naganishii CBS 8797]CCK72286.1 hypothetical protein KNAG_0J02050 [Kazachstania naganishii CBS 8797]